MILCLNVFKWHINSNNIPNVSSLRGTSEIEHINIYLPIHSLKHKTTHTNKNLKKNSNSSYFGLIEILLNTCWVSLAELLTLSNYSIEEEDT